MSLSGGWIWWYQNVFGGEVEDEVISTQIGKSLVLGSG